MPGLAGCSAANEIPCLAGTYNNATDKIDAGACLPCPPASHSPEASTSIAMCTCIEDYYDSSTFSEDVLCLRCPVGSACVGTGNTLAFLPLAKGYYRASIVSTDLRKCPDFSAGNESACIGSGSWIGTCRPWTEGPYCRLCNVSDGSRYYDPSKSACLPCKGSIATPLAVLAAITVSVLLLLCWCGWRKPYTHVPAHIRDRLLKLGHQMLSKLRAPAKQMVAFYQVRP